LRHRGRIRDGAALGAAARPAEKAEMYLDLAAASAGRCLAVYDPSRAERDLAIGVDDKELPGAALDAARDGRLLLVHIPEECEARIRVFIGEEPSAVLLAAAHPSRVEGAFLAIPSGTLAASGAEDVGNPHADADPDLRSIGTVPAGAYRLAAFHTFHWKARHRAGLLVAKTTPGERWLLRIGNALGIGAAIFLVGNFFGLPWTGALLLKHGIWKPLATFLGLDATFLACLLLGSRFLDASPRYRAALELRDGIDAEIPDVVVVLTRGGAPDGAAPALLEVPV
jgi:hypothetical protein